MTGRDTRGTYACLGVAGCTGCTDGRHPSVTTILGAVLAKRGLDQWRADCAADEAPRLLREALALTSGIGSAAEAATLLEAHRDHIRKAHERQRDKAAARGSSVHRIVQALAEGREPLPSDLTDEVTPYLGALRQFCDAEKPRVLFSECVVSSRHGYAGTLDAIHREGTAGRVIRDWKTRKDESRARLYGEEVLQLAAYRYAHLMRDADGTVRKMPRIDAAEVVLLWPPVSESDPGYRIERVQADREAHRIFLRCLEIYRWQRASKER